MLEIECWDWDRLSRNDPLGNATLHLGHLVPQGLGDGANVVCSVQLKDSQAVPGEVFFEIMYEGAGGRGGMQGPPGRAGSYGGGPRSAGGYPGTPHGSVGHPTPPHGVPPRIAQSFNYFDTNRSGYLDYGELRNALRHYGIQADQLQSAELVRRYDDQPDGRLEIAEFAELVRDLEQGVLRAPGAAARSPYGGGQQVPARVAAAFEECDVNRSGYLDYGELRPALQRYGVDVSEGQAASIIRAYDDRPDGRLDVQEFARLVRDIEAGSMRREGGPRSSHGGYAGAGYPRSGGARSPYSGAAGRWPRPASPGRAPSTPYGGGGGYGGYDGGYGGYSSGYGSSYGSSERGTSAMMYLLDVLFRTVVYALATAALVAPERVGQDADAVARAAGQGSAAAAISTVPGIVWYAVLGLLVVLALVALNCCGLRRPIVSCFDCAPGPCSRFCHAIASCCRGGYDRYGDERYGSSYGRSSYGGGYGGGGYGGYSSRVAPAKSYERL